MRDDLACRDVVELVTEYLEGGLSARDRDRFERHLGGCPACSGYLQQIRTAVRLLGRLEPDDIDPVVREELVAAFRGWRAGSDDGG